MRSVYLCALAILATAGVALAADFSTQYKDAFGDFEKRGDSPAYAQSCADKAREAFSLAADDAQKYDALVLQSRCTYYVGMKARTDDDKIKIFGLAKNFAEQAKQYQKDRAEAFYFYAINLGRWAEANGILKSLGERHNLRRNSEAVLTKIAAEEGKTYPGKEYDGWGANRTLGRMYFKLPGMFGGDNQKAERYLREAVEKMSAEYPNSLNIVYLAEVLVANGKKAEARKLLDDLIRYELEPAKYNPKRVPETVDDIKEAKTLRKDLGN